MRYRTLMGDDYGTYTKQIIKYANANGIIIPSSDIIDAMETFIGQLVANDLWNRFDIFYNFAYNNVNLKDFARINWKSPGDFTITYNGTVDYGVDGYKGTYDSSYAGLKLNTGFVPSTHAVQYQPSNSSAFLYGNIALPYKGIPDGDGYGRDGAFIFSDGVQCIGSMYEFLNPQFNFFSTNSNNISQIPSNTFNSPQTPHFFLIDRLYTNHHEFYRDTNDLFGQVTSTYNSSLSSNQVKLLGSYKPESGLYDDSNFMSLFGLGCSFLDDTHNGNFYSFLNTFRAAIGL